MQRQTIAQKWWADSD